MQEGVVALGPGESDFSSTQASEAHIIICVALCKCYEDSAVDSRASGPQWHLRVQWLETRTGRGLWPVVCTHCHGGQVQVPV